MSLTEFLSPSLARFFEEISAIPRASLDEGRIADYLVELARRGGLEFYRDEAHNVLIKKEGSKGRENEPALLLQAHTDMVTEIAFGTSHDFSQEGVRLVQKGSVLWAEGTTLGADDGFGVALMLAVLEDRSLSHPPLECLFTAAEEIGLVGAGKFDYSRISARRMLNFDSAEEHLIITGCCGGIRTDLHLPVAKTAVSETGLKISLHGLAGGHSGEDIHRGRANALCVMGEILKRLEKHTPFRLASLHGGDKDNAIPRDCEAVILPCDLGAAKAFLDGTESLLCELAPCADDAARTISAELVPVDAVMSDADLLGAMTVLSLKNGVFYRRRDGKEPPETSRTLASVRTLDGELKFSLSTRSPFDARIEESVAELDRVAATLGGSTEHRSRYPGWEGSEDSPVCALWAKAYKQETGREIRTTVIHAGLECGLISAHLPGLEVISVGCNVYDLHTPAERMELDSLERIYRTLLAFLKEC